MAPEILCHNKLNQPLEHPPSSEKYASLDLHPYEQPSEVFERLVPPRKDELF